MAITMTEQAVHALEIVREEEIAASIEDVFDAILEEMGPENKGPDGVPMPMVIEAWPGGRWFRDLGNGAGHFWGNVQAIKRPALLEICGPLFMSYPAVSNVQYRLTEENGITRLKFVHRALGQIQHSERIEGGWGSIIARIRTAAEGKKA